MSKSRVLSQFKNAGVIALLFALSTASTAYAQTMPWQRPLDQLKESLQGPTAQTIIILAIIMAGLAFAVGEAGSFFRRCAGAVFGGAIAIGASSWAPTLFGW